MYFPDGIHEDDFDNLPFNVMAVPKGVSILDHFPVLKQYQEFEPTFLEDCGIKHDSVLKYVFLLYQNKSPLMKFDDLIRRKREAAQMAGFPFQEDGMPTEHVDMILKGQAKVVNDMIIRLARIQHNTKFAALVVGTEAYYNKLALVLNDIDIEDSTKTEADIEKIKGELWRQALKMEDDLNTISLQLLAQDNNPYLKKDLFCIVDRENSQLKMPTPEVAAKEIFNYGQETV